MFKVNDKDTRGHHCRRSGVFIVNFEQISHIISVDLNRRQQVSPIWLCFEEILTTNY